MKRMFFCHGVFLLSSLNMLLIGSGNFLFFPLLENNASAQVTTAITSSGLNTTVTQAGNTYNITGGTRPGNGTNLFHSFGEFSISTLDTARFLNSPPQLATTNILGRVSGGSPSLLFGTIDTLSYGGANLFLMNPVGIVFGPNATLNVGGSVAFTTAHYLRLAEADGTSAGIFHADTSASSLLSSAPVTAFGFLGSFPGSIVVQGSTLSVPNGQSFSLIGGNVEVGQATIENGTTQQATLSAPNGHIRFASAASPGEFLYTDLSSAPNLDRASFSSYGILNMTPGSGVNVSGTNTVSIRSGQFVLSVTDAVLTTAESPIAQESVSLGQGSALVATTAETGTGPDLQIVAEHINLDGTSVITRNTGEGAAGETSLVAQTVQLTNGTSILSSNEGIGSGSPISLTAGESIEISGSDINGASSRVVSESLGDGGGGAISILAPTVTFDQGGAGSSLQTILVGMGSAGGIAVDAQTVKLRGSSGIQSFNFSPSIGGNIKVTGRTITIADGSYVESVNSSDAGGGNIEIRATDSVTVIGVDPLFGAPSRILTQTDFSGKAGDVTVEAGKHVTVAGGGAIQSVGLDGPSGTISVVAQDTMTITGSFDSSTPSLISNLSLGSGANGGVHLRAKNFFLTDSGQLLTETFDQGGGSISVSATETALLTGGTRITTQSTLSDSGSVDITAASLSLAQDARINTRTIGPGSAGSITLNATAGDIALSGGSRIRSSIDRGGSGQGGAIVASASGSVLLSEGSFLNSNTTGSGSAGAITLTAGTRVSMTDAGSGLFSETTGLGNGGNINIASSQSIEIYNGATISAQGSGTGSAGNIAITAGSDFQSNGGIVRTTASQGPGGDIVITAGQDIRLNNGASISSSSTGPGNAGNITAIAGDDFIMQNSSITTQAVQASGGNIKIGAADQIVIRNSLISASVMGGSGSGGNISIDPNAVILQNSRILAQAIQGNGGNISIITPFFLADQASVINASSQFGLNGTITIQSPTSNLSGSLGTLATKPRQAQSLLTQRCAALANGQASSFVVAGREQLPADPGGWLTSPLALAGLDADPFSEGTVAEGTSNLAPRTAGLLANGTVSLRRFTPAGFLMANYANSEATGCHS
ncbi:MAG: filamentous hemagglutinin N-terminal domain-containing protein [Nitrospiraceae bacterium]